ncbi:hypothetical protein Tco_1121401 [Tanacetum coccineum]|uniref:Uncharacterized protein n=1 Tax=Tanacetum coccineum TaxID=301880 RepID=A0ABQ5IYL0_9ASTR
MSSQEQPSQVPITEPITDTTSHPTRTPSPMPNEPPLGEGNTSRSGEGSMQLLELMELCTKLSDKITSLEDDLKQTKKIYGKAITKLVKKDLVSEDTSKQRRMTETEYEGFALQHFTPTKVTQDASREKVKTYTRRRITDSSKDSTAGGLFSTAEEAQGKEQISTDKKEMARAATREEQERIDFEKALELQKQLDERKETDNIDWNTIVEQNMAGYKMGYFKGMSYDEIRPIFEEEYNKIQTLFKKDTEVEKSKAKRIVEETLVQESFKKLRTAEASRSKPIQEQPTEEPKELSEEELKKMLEIVPVEKTKPEALQIISVGNITEAYQVFEDMLKGFDRKDLVTLWSLVKERFRSTEPTEDKERALWVELKRLFEPDKDDVLWKLLRYMYDSLTWRLYGTCGVHYVSSTRGHDIYMLIKKDYPLSTAVMNLMLSRRLQVEEDIEMAKDLIMNIFLEANKPRR